MAKRRTCPLRTVSEAALRASEQRYRALFESIDDGYALMQILFDEQNRCVDYRFLETNAVLVVDDDADARELISELLHQCRISVRVASSGEDGLRAIATACPDILISDIGMPGLDGYQFIERVRALAVGAGGGIPAIALTAFARTQDRMRALVAGFNNHVPKPVEPMELFAVLSSLARQMRNRPSA